MNIPPIPIQVLYAGLAGTVLALIVATATNRWSLKVFFLLALRLAIGWHFLFEGLHKVHSHYVGPGETNRPFTSEPYFTLGEGPLAKVMREKIGDPEKQLDAKLTPQNADKLAALSPDARVDRRAGTGEYRRPNGEPYESFPDFLARKKAQLSPADLKELEDAGKGEAFIEATAKDYAERAVGDVEAFAAMVPAEVRKEWDSFVSAFADKYHLTAEEKARLDGKLDDKERAELVAARQALQTVDAKKRKELTEKSGPGDLTVEAMSAYARWAVGVEPRASKLKFVSGDSPLTAPQRLEYIRHREAEVAELERRAADKLGVGHGIEMAKLKDAKALVALAKSALLTDADDFITELKKEAITGILVPRFERKAPGPTVVFGGLDPDPEKTPTAQQLKKADDARAEKLPTLVPKEAPEGEVKFDQLPPEVRAIWEQYRKEFKESYPIGDKADEVDHAFDLLTRRLANWYYDRDEFLGAPKPPKTGFAAMEKRFEEAKKHATGPEYEEAGLFGRLVRWVRMEAALGAAYAGLEKKYGDLKSALAAAVPADVVAGPVTVPPAKDTKFVESLDWQTRWGITAIGALLLLGLFTRIACLAGVAFLVMTYLTHPPFPWLPLPPGTEGNPIFVNKNVIEALGLLVIMVHPTGRWLGLDALIHRAIFRNSREYRAEPPAPKAETRTAKK